MTPIGTAQCNFLIPKPFFICWLEYFYKERLSPWQWAGSCPLQLYHGQKFRAAQQRPQSSVCSVSPDGDDMGRCRLESLPPLPTMIPTRNPLTPKKNEGGEKAKHSSALELSTYYIRVFIILFSTLFKILKYLTTTCLIIQENVFMTLR